MGLLHLLLICFSAIMLVAPVSSQTCEADLVSPITKYASLVFCTAHAHCYCAHAAVDLINNYRGITNVEKVLCEWVFRSNYEIRIALNNVVTYADSETIQISSCTTRATQQM